MLEDRNYIRQTPFEPRRSATVAVLVANVVAFVIQCALYHYPPTPPSGSVLALSLEGLKHGYVWQLLTFQFMHAGLLHLAFNCLAIFMIGRAVEEALGRKNFLTLYLLSGVIGGLVQMLAAACFPTRFGGSVVGASAGAFGLVAAFAMLFPERQITLLIFFVIPVTLRAKYLLVGSAVFALLGIAFFPSTIAEAAHLGGMLCGVIFVRYAVHWRLRWPRFKPSTSRPPRRLVQIHSQKPGLWNRAKSAEPEALSPEEFVSKEVDPILDKISAQGFQSLTERERRILETARTKMGKR